MRNLSMVVILLLTCATLPAQTATGNNPIVLILPLIQPSNSCPLAFSVDRRSQGELIWTSSESDGIKSHDSLSLMQSEGVLRSEPGFSNLSAKAQQIRLDQLAQLSNKQRGQGVTLHFANPEKQIVAADIVVHGYPNSVFVVPAALLRSDVTESFYLTAHAGEPLLHSSIWTQRLMVRWVELTRLEYADGTTWKPSSPRQCHAAPSLYLAVGSAR